mmetsp:Transcript_26329/g.43123  ORF Transcript_26329/g.43123 Transcript_26329/m.43123 type:complete len:239 (-) Transcript_26329:247-963(-)
MPSRQRGTLSLPRNEGDWEREGELVGEGVLTAAMRVRISAALLCRYSLPSMSFLIFWYAGRLTTSLLSNTPALPNGRRCSFRSASPCEYFPTSGKAGNDPVPELGVKLCWRLGKKSGQRAFRRHCCAAADTNASRGTHVVGCIIKCCASEPNDFIQDEYCSVQTTWAGDRCTMHKYCPLLAEFTDMKGWKAALQTRDDRYCSEGQSTTSTTGPGCAGVITSLGLIWVPFGNTTIFPSF